MKCLFYQSPVVREIEFLAFVAPKAIGNVNHFEIFKSFFTSIRNFYADKQTDGKSAFYMRR